MDNRKFCVDCEYSYQIAHPEYGYGDMLCDHPKSKQECEDFLVYGRYVNTSCKKMRDWEDLCGPAGILFKPKQHMKDRVKEWWNVRKSI